MISIEQQIEEQRKEAEFNAVAEAIISTQAWGQFYGLMKGAADLGEGMLRHQVCVAPDGRIIKVAQGKAGKWIQSFIRPAHEHAARSFSQGKWGRGILGLAGFGWITNLVEQKRAKCLTITPEEYLQELNKRRNMSKTGISGAGAGAGSATGSLGGTGGGVSGAGSSWGDGVGSAGSGAGTATGSTGEGTSNPLAPNSSNEAKKRMSTPLKIGIIVGSAVVLGILGYIIVKFKPFSSKK